MKNQPKVLFATTNVNKVKRVKNLMDDCEVEILSLSDLAYAINEPEEVGNTPLEIAMNKAQYYWDQLNPKIPVLAQDDTLELLNFEGKHSKILSIKKPVEEKYGSFNDENAIQYYRELAKNQGGSIEMSFNYGFGFTNEGKTIGEKAELRCVLVDDASKVITPGYFLNSIIKVKVLDKWIFYSEVTKDQQKIVDESIARSVRSVLEGIQLSTCH